MMGVGNPFTPDSRRTAISPSCMTNKNIAAVRLFLFMKEKVGTSRISPPRETAIETIHPNKSVEPSKEIENVAGDSNSFFRLFFCFYHISSEISVSLESLKVSILNCL